MRKVILMGFAAVVTIAGLIAGKNCFVNDTNLTQTLLMQNVEALSDVEDDDVLKTCMSMYVEAPAGNSLALSMRVCSDCRFHWIVSCSEPSKCKTDEN